jgi:hypothetical protein
VDVLGVAEPTLQRSGDARTIVELSAVTDPDEAVAVIGRTAQLTFHPVESAAEAADIGEAASGELVSVQDGAALPDDARMPLQLGPPALAGDAVGTAGMATGPTGGFDVTVDFRGAIVLTPPSVTPPDRAFLRQAEDALLGEVYGRPVTGDEAPGWPAAGEPAPRTLRSCPATSCRPRRSAACRELLDAPFGDDLDNTDSEHALGGWLVLVHEGGVLVAHTAVVPRHPDLVRHRFQAGYVEAVATRSHRQGHGFGSARWSGSSRSCGSGSSSGRCRPRGACVLRTARLGALAGPTFVREGDRLRRTADEDDGILVRRLGAAPRSGSTPACRARPARGMPGDR